MLKGLTARYLLKATYPVTAGQTILVTAAAGGVGQILCQWARHLGVTVIGTVGSDEKAALARAHGCTHVLNSRRDDIALKVREITSGAGVPVVYDSVGKESFEASLNALSVRGMLVSFGSASGPVPPFDITQLMAKGSLYITRPTLVHYTRDAREIGEGAADLFDVLSSGAVTVDIHQRYALADARAAHEALAARATRGATILLP
jgi:NADPH2:quinone reductase